MINLLLMEKTKELEELSLKLGFSDALYLNSEIIEIKSIIKKEIINEINKAHQKGLKTIIKPKSSELLRFVLEKTKIDYVYGLEWLNRKDHLHYPHSGLNQVICKIIKENNKQIVFSFADFLNSKNKGLILNRRKYNLKLAKKYGLDYPVMNLSKNPDELRSAKDLKQI